MRGLSGVDAQDAALRPTDGPPKPSPKPKVDANAAAAAKPDDVTRASSGEEKKSGSDPKTKPAGAADHGSMPRLKDFTVKPEFWQSDELDKALDQDDLASEVFAKLTESLGAITNRAALESALATVAAEPVAKRAFIELVNRWAPSAKGPSSKSDTGPAGGGIPEELAYVAAFYAGPPEGGGAPPDPGIKKLVTELRVPLDNIERLLDSDESGSITEKLLGSIFDQTRALALRAAAGDRLAYAQYSALAETEFMKRLEYIWYQRLAGKHQCHKSDIASPLLDELNKVEGAPKVRPPKDRKSIAIRDEIYKPAHKIAKARLNELKKPPAK